MKIEILPDIFDGETIHSGRSFNISMGALGEECLAKIWHGWRWSSPARPIKNRIQRIFNKGNSTELKIIEALKEKGVKFYDRDDGKQHKFYGFSKHVAGKVDGIIEKNGEKMLLEIKSSNQKNYNSLIKHGLVKTFPNYYDTVQRYLEASSLDKCLYIIMCKNDESICTMIVHRDNDKIKSLLEKEKSIIFQETPFRAQYHSGFYKCSYCDHYSVCHLKGDPEQNCRTCKNGDVHDEGIWKCGLTDKELSIEEQKIGCDKYERLF